MYRFHDGTLTTKSTTTWMADTNFTSTELFPIKMGGNLWPRSIPKLSVDFRLNRFWPHSCSFCVVLDVDGRDWTTNDVLSLLDWSRSLPGAHNKWVSLNSVLTFDSKQFFAFCSQSFFLVLQVNHKAFATDTTHGFGARLLLLLIYSLFALIYFFSEVAKLEVTCTVSLSHCP